MAKTFVEGKWETLPGNSESLRPATHQMKRRAARMVEGDR